MRSLKTKWAVGLLLGATLLFLQRDAAAWGESTWVNRGLENGFQSETGSGSIIPFGTRGPAIVTAATKFLMLKTAAFTITGNHFERAIVLAQAMKNSSDPKLQAAANDLLRVIHEQALALVFHAFTRPITDPQNHEVEEINVARLNYLAQVLVDCLRLSEISRPVLLRAVSEWFWLETPSFSTFLKVAFDPERASLIFRSLDSETAEMFLAALSRPPAPRQPGATNNLLFLYDPKETRHTSSYLKAFTFLYSAVAINPELVAPLVTFAQQLIIYPDLLRPETQGVFLALVDFINSHFSPANNQELATALRATLPGFEKLAKNTVSIDYNIEPGSPLDIALARVSALGEAGLKQLIELARNEGSPVLAEQAAMRILHNDDPSIIKIIESGYSGYEKEIAAIWRAAGVIPRAQMEAAWKNRTRSLEKKLNSSGTGPETILARVDQLAPETTAKIMQDQRPLDQQNLVDLGWPAIQYDNHARANVRDLEGEIAGAATSMTAPELSMALDALNQAITASQNDLSILPAKIYPLVLRFHKLLIIARGTSTALPFEVDRKLARALGGIESLSGSKSAAEHALIEEGRKGLKALDRALEPFTYKPLAK